MFKNKFIVLHGLYSNNEYYIVPEKIVSIVSQGDDKNKSSIVYVEGSVNRYEVRESVKDIFEIVNKKS